METKAEGYTSDNWSTS